MARQRKGSPVHGWLDPRQAARHDLDQGRGPREASLRGGQGGACRHARSARDRRAADRASARRPRPCPSWSTASKEYRFTVRFGAETDTDDAEGKVVATSDRRPTRAEIEADAARLHRRDRARCRRATRRSRSTARAPTTSPATRRNSSLRRGTCRSTGSSSSSMPDPDHCVHRGRCGKGTYVRALARDLGRALGSLGHVAALRRTRVGAFGEEPGDRARQAGGAGE